MTKSMKKTLIGSISVAVIILVIAAVTTPNPTPSQTLSQVVVTNPASLSLINPVGGNVELGQRQNVAWTSFNYAPKTVAINIIRKVSDNPARYELVRTVSVATLNDGSAVWVPAPTELGSNIYVEVGCVLSNQGCTASYSADSLAVIDNGRYSNTAAAYQAIENKENN
jgi:hypothetical protein